jgi:hypothetical protein
MKTTYSVIFRTGAELSDNDRYRIRERIEEAIKEIAAEYMADYEVDTNHFIPGPHAHIVHQGRDWSGKR